MLSILAVALAALSFFRGHAPDQLDPSGLVDDGRSSPHRATHASRDRTAPSDTESPTLESRIALVERLDQIEAQIETVSSKVSDVIQANPGDGLSPQRAVVLFHELGEDVDSGRLSPAERWVDERGVQIEEERYRLKISDGLTVLRVEQMLSRGGEWFPRPLWKQDGSTLRLVYRRKTVSSAGATDSYALPPGVLRIWAFRKRD